MPFNDLREFITFLESAGELIRTQKPVDVKYEISAYIRKTSDVQGPALLFDNVKGFDMPVLVAFFRLANEHFSLSKRPTKITSTSFSTPSIIWWRRS